MDQGRPDVRKHLQVLRAEWEQCRACELGQYREHVGGQFVFGEGSIGGVMFIGEGPGKDEEQHGRPFIGESGQFLRDVIKEVGFTNYYITNSVACRSWKLAYDNEGNQRFDRRGQSIRNDDKPNPAQVKACLPRLHQEIYIVDPVLIVTLGAAAAEAVLHKSIAVQTQGNMLYDAEVPGAGFRPLRTPKGAWARRVGPKEDRRLVWPYEQNMVMYPVLPLVHPAFAMSNHQDRRPGSPMNLFATGMRQAQELYAKYCQEVYGEAIVERELSDNVFFYRSQDEGTDY